MEDLVAYILDIVIIAEQINQQLLVLGLERLNINALQVWDINLVSPDLETLHVAEHGECLPRAHVFPDLVVLLHKQLVEHVVVFVLTGHILFGYLHCTRDQLLPGLSLISLLFLQVLYDFGLPDTVVKEEPFNFSSKPFSTYVLSK